MLVYAVFFFLLQEFFQISHLSIDAWSAFFLTFASESRTEIHIHLERISNNSPKIIVISTCQSDQNVSNAADQVKTFKTVRSYIFNPIPIILWGQIKKHKKNLKNCK